jgi:hypothetical protein
MNLRLESLKHTVLKKVSVDEFAPKTGEDRDVAVLGLYVNQQSPGEDLFRFLTNSVIEHRDLEVSPNPNLDGYYMVFVELDRNQDLFKNIQQLLAEIRRVTGPLNWELKTPYVDEYVPLDQAEYMIQQDPDTYLPPAEFAKKLQPHTQTTHATEDIMEFFRNSNLLSVDVDQQHRIKLRDARGTAQLQLVEFGNHTEVMQNLGITESAIKQDYDLHLFGKLKSMLGEMRAVPIDEYILIFHPEQSEVLVTKPC